MLALTALAERQITGAPFLSNWLNAVMANATLYVFLRSVFPGLPEPEQDGRALRPGDGEDTS